MAATPERRLVVNADDLGLSAGVNRGILEAHAAGTVTSASVMVNLPAFADAVQRAAAAPSLGTGLHFNIVLGRPLTSAPTLVDARTGEFLPLAALARRAFAGAIAPADVYAECAAQLARLRGAGLAVTHVDGHRHAHALPGVWPAVVRAARDAGVTTVRVPLEPPAVAMRAPAALAKRALLGASWRLASRGARDVRRPDRFVGIALQGGGAFAPRLRRLLSRLPAGSAELMVHPGHDDAELAALDPYRVARETELAALTSAGVRESLAPFRLVSFAGI